MIIFQIYYQPPIPPNIPIIGSVNIGDSSAGGGGGAPVPMQVGHIPESGGGFGNREYFLVKISFLFEK